MKNVCKRCLLSEMDAEFFSNLTSYIENMDADKKADDETYRTRLAVCRDCSFLAEGMCRACGCYVELRAVVKTQKCPYEKW